MNKNPEYDGSTMLKSVMQEAFVSNILAGLPQYEAYKQAGYSPKSENSLMVSSTQLLRTSKVKARLDYKRRAIEVKSELTAEIVVKKLKEIAFNELGSDKVQVQHQLSALDMINKHLGLYERDNAQKGLTLIEILAIAGPVQPLLEADMGDNA